MTGSPALSLHGLTKHYRGLVAVDEVSLTVESGEVFGFLGVNGAGKTTTIRMLLDLLRPTRGHASVFGFDCHRQGVEARRQIGYLPGEMPIYPDLTGFQYVQYLAALGDRPVARPTLDRLLGRFGLSSADLQRTLREDSHGTKRKFGLVQALMTEAPLIILDEPTSGLDPVMIESFVEIVGELKQRGAAVFLSSHVLAEVGRLCDRIGIIRRGRLIDVQSLATLRQNAPRRVTIDFLAPVAVPPPAPATALNVTPRRWCVELHGPLGPFLAAIRDLPVDDLQIEPFKLDDYVLERYATRGD